MSNTAESLLPLGKVNATVWIAAVVIAALFAQPSLVAMTLLSWWIVSAGSASAPEMPKLVSEGPIPRMSSVLPAKLRARAPS
ncbi:MAG: hypothetical protein EBU32_06405 [Opitutaceae bacterium]|nr:hypothetical protein [Opitutaceae bacterium]